MVFFTSDQHLGHWNINEYCHRGFSTVEEMDASLIYGWNSVVGPDDKVYHLGDFCLGSSAQAAKYIAQLNGSILFLTNPWHHDGSWLSGIGREGLVSKSGHQAFLLPPIHVLEFDEYGDGKYPKALVLCHYPFHIWDRSHYGSWHLHGHSHNQKELFRPPSELRINVAVDARSRRDWRPLSLTWVANVMRELERSNQ